MYDLFFAPIAYTFNYRKHIMINTLFFQDQMTFLYHDIYIYIFLCIMITLKFISYIMIIVATLVAKNYWNHLTTIY